MDFKTYFENYFLDFLDSYFFVRIVERRPWTPHFSVFHCDFTPLPSLLPLWVNSSNNNK